MKWWRMLIGGIILGVLFFMADAHNINIKLAIFLGYISGGTLYGITEEKK